MFIDNQGVESKVYKHSYRNIQEKEQIMDLVRLMIESGIQQDQIGVIIPYKGQIMELQDAFRSNYW